ncbi:unnamed protein product [Clonostachys rosea f. rosea IK726]|uniref:Histone acetyltransferase n=2 Tax=Bionectria ochroleuca TaxID=29856 RepID=A0A0B7JSX9_BIOOC|nr:unnamed protein product [Clonostachys rosea f. rosea IK726]
MPNAQAMEDELQQSVLLSEDADPEANSSDEPTTIHAIPRALSSAASDSREDGLDDESAMEDIEMTSDRDASGDEVNGEEVDEEGYYQGEEEEEEEEDAEGEDDYEIMSGLPQNHNNHLSDDDAETGDEDAEGEEEVGDDDVASTTVRLRPEDAEERDEESEVSTIASAADEDESDEEENWEDARDTAEDEDEEESETGPSNICMFCKEDEEHDPSEDFEAYLTCKKCGENSHQQCARESAAMNVSNHPKNWRCPDCYDEESEAEDDEGSDGNEEQDVDRLDSQQPSQDVFDGPAGSDGVDSLEGPNGETVNGSADGPRLLRKRKSPSTEPEENSVSLRKRRRSSHLLAGLEEPMDTASLSETTASRSRTLRLKVSRPPPVSVERQTRGSLVLKIQVRPGNLKEILSRRKRDGRRAGGSTNTPRPPRTPAPPVATPQVRAAPVIAAAIETPFTADSYSQPFYSFFDRDTDDVKGKPYGGILSEAEADTSKTLPMADDRRRFDQAKQKAEDEWRARVLAIQAETDIPNRKSKKANENASQIECIEFGGWEIDTWYAAPYPAEYSRNRVLYICEFCLKYMNSDYVAWRHKLKCSTKHPPGDEIYRDETIAMFEVDGRKNPVYCQNLCLLAKLFLGSKTLYYDVEPFLFYVLCEYDDCGYHFVGYFSKEKRPSSQNNVSCILTLPIHQRKGYGNLLIDFSYLLTRVEQKTGSPEKPLSDMGLVSYRNYWRLVLCQYFLNIMDSDDYKKNGLSIKKMSDDTGMTADDVISALEGLRALVRDPQTKLYAFRIDLDYCREYVTKWEAKGHVKLKPEALAWTPYVMGRSVANVFDLGPLSTIAPREDDEAKIQEGPNTVGAETNPILNGVGSSTDEDTAHVGPVGEAADHDQPEKQRPSEGLSGKNAVEVTPPAVNGIETKDESEIIIQNSLLASYESIPSTRFEIFPPLSKRSDRNRQSISRPPPPPRRVSSSAPRPPPKRSGGSGGSSRKPSSSRPKSSSSKRKTGGTGRGPGRWPKGTKKSDYGNADSGPGFPPGWRASDTHIDVQPAMAKEADNSINARIDRPAQDEVQVFVASAGATTNSVKDEVVAIKAIGVEEDEEDVDAEGEDE